MLCCSALCYVMYNMSRNVILYYASLCYVNTRRVEAHLTPSDVSVVYVVKSKRRSVNVKPDVGGRLRPLSCRTASGTNEPHVDGSS